MTEEQLQALHEWVRVECKYAIEKRLNYSAREEGEYADKLFEAFCNLLSKK